MEKEKKELCYYNRITRLKGALQTWIHMNGVFIWDSEHAVSMFWFNLHILEWHAQTLNCQITHTVWYIRDPGARKLVVCFFKTGIVWNKPVPSLHLFLMAIGSVSTEIWSLVSFRGLLLSFFEGSILGDNVGDTRWGGVLSDRGGRQSCNLCSRTSVVKETTCPYYES